MRLSSSRSARFQFNDKCGNYASRVRPGGNSRSCKDLRVALFSGRNARSRLRQRSFDCSDALAKASARPSMLVASAPGGPSIYKSACWSRLDTAFGQTIIVDNRPVMASSSGRRLKSPPTATFAVETAALTRSTATLRQTHATRCAFCGGHRVFDDRHGGTRRRACGHFYSRSRQPPKRPGRLNVLIPAPLVNSPACVVGAIGQDTTSTGRRSIGLRAVSGEADSSSASNHARSHAVGKLKACGIIAPALAGSAGRADACRAGRNRIRHPVLEWTVRAGENARRQRAHGAARHRASVANA